MFFEFLFSYLFYLIMKHLYTPLLVLLLASFWISSPAQHLPVKQQPLLWFQSDTAFLPASLVYDARMNGHELSFGPGKVAPAMLNYHPALRLDTIAAQVNYIPKANRGITLLHHKLKEQSKKENNTYPKTILA